MVKIFKNIRMLFFVGIMVLAGVYGTGCSTGKNEVREGLKPCGTFKNPIMKGADPWVIKNDEFYYFCKSQGGGIYVSKSKKLTEPKNWKLVCHQPKKGWNKANLWAPELHHIQGKWYIYYAAGKSGPPFINQRAGVLASVTDDPQGKYQSKGKLYTGDNIDDQSNNKWAIDLTVFTNQNQLYAIWSGWKKNRDTDKTPQHLYIARMSNPWTISSNRVKISSPEESWETGGPLDINEGPEVLKHGNQIFVIYSTRESWLKYYRLGQLKLKMPAANPLQADSWIKKGPVFKGTRNVYGVGHASFTISPDGSEHWIVYHSKVDTTPGWNRNVRMQSFRLNKNGSPEFGKPVTAGKKIKVPSGQCHDNN